LLVVSTVAPVGDHRPSFERDANTLIPNGDHAADDEEVADDESRGEKEKNDPRHETASASTSSVEDDCGSETNDSAPAAAPPAESDKTRVEAEPVSEDSKTRDEADTNSVEKSEASGMHFASLKLIAKVHIVVLFPESCDTNEDSSSPSEPKSTSMEIEEESNGSEEEPSKETFEAAEAVPNGSSTPQMEKEEGNPGAASEEPMDAASEDDETPCKKQKLDDDLELCEPVQSDDEAKNPVSQDDAIVPASAE
jgi:hypothetical protein